MVESWFELMHIPWLHRQCRLQSITVATKNELSRNVKMNVRKLLRIEGRTDKNKLVKHQIMKMTKGLVWATCCFNNAHASKSV